MSSDQAHHAGLIKNGDTFTRKRPVDSDGRYRVLMQVLRISIRNQYDTGFANTGSHTLITNDNTPLSLTHSRSQLLTSNKLQELVLDQ